MRSQTPKPAGHLLLRLLFVLPVLAALLAGLLGGLLRAGVGLPEGLAGAWLGQAVGAHAFLMICSFIGTVIGIERAVALKAGLGYLAPLGSGLAGLALLAGAEAPSRWLLFAATLVFVAVNARLVQRQRAAHTLLLLIAALCWALGSLLLLLAAPAGAVLPWWFAFLILTIAAERLEMTRLMRRRAGAAGALGLILAALLAGAALSGLLPRSGGLLYGAALLALAAWLLVFDIARRTVRAQGLSRYMAVCLLLGYAWLAVAGAAWMATTLGLPWRDAALHALALGFVFSMMLGHAPVILPAIARIKVQFGWAYYLPLALLHLSLLLRLFGAPLHDRALAAGSAGNAIAIAAFLFTLVASGLLWQRQHRSPSSPSRSIRHAED